MDLFFKSAAFTYDHNGESCENRQNSRRSPLLTGIAEGLVLRTFWGEMPVPRVPLFSFQKLCILLTKYQLKKDAAILLLREDFKTLMVVNCVDVYE